MLELAGVDAFYGGSQALYDVSLSVPEGELVTVLGRNGVGKTTLLKRIMGLAPGRRGRVAFGERDVAAWPTHARARLGIAYVPQGREIIGEFSVRENILLGCHARPDRSSRLPELAMELFPYLRENLTRRGGLLSGGQQQQLAIARALAAEPRVLLMDEPTEGIQPSIVEQIERTIVRLNREFRITVVLVEQKVKFARAAAARFVLLEKGRVAAAGEMGTLTDDLVRRHLAV